MSLDDIVFAGKTTKRRMELKVTVDGTEGAALGVMSQGELHSLALSLFLPRATLPASPFRFLVIDDPVQSMDPARVEGLAQVLDEVAQQRQVIVFTHDDRLPDAVRRMGISAQVLEVLRQPRSEVQVRTVLGPAQQYLEDAFALAKTSNLPPSVANRVARRALEACLDPLWRVKAPAIGDVSRHAQLIGLPEYLPDRLLAYRVRYAWAALSNACHHHVYELAPSVPELVGWIDCLEKLAFEVEACKNRTRAKV